MKKLFVILILLSTISGCEAVCEVSSDIGGIRNEFGNKDVCLVCKKVEKSYLHEVAWFQFDCPIVVKAENEN